MLEFISPSGTMFIAFGQLTFGWVMKPWAISKVKWSNQHGIGLDVNIDSPFLSISLSFERLQKDVKVEIKQSNKRN